MVANRFKVVFGSHVNLDDPSPGVQLVIRGCMGYANLDVELFPSVSTYEGNVRDEVPIRSLRR
ncbi:hypothetical protein D3C86_1472790 [compost metagenome]